MLWAADSREDLVAEHPESSITEIASKLGKLWKKVSDSEKAQYTSQAATLKAAYAKKMEKYKKSSHYAKHQKAVAEFKEKEKKKPFRKDKNAPKRPMSGYMVFVNAVRNDVVAENPDMSVTDVLKEIGVMWGDLGESEKKKYTQKAVGLKAKYEKELRAYQKTKQYKEYQEEKEAFYAKRKADKKRSVSRSASRARKVKKPKKQRSARRRSTSRRRRRRSATPKAPSSSASASSSRSRSRRSSTSRSRSRSTSRRRSTSRSRTASRRRRRRSSVPKAPKPRARLGAKFSSKKKAAKRRAMAKKKGGLVKGKPSTPRAPSRHRSRSSTSVGSSASRRRRSASSSRSASRRSVSKPRRRSRKRAARKRRTIA